MSIVAIITARGGSKGLIRKNVRKLAGKPLIVHTIEAALQSRYVTTCLVTTEDAEIKQVSLAAGAKVLDRPVELAEDGSLSRDVVLHALQALERQGALPEYFILLQPTSPLRTACHIDACIQQFLAEGGGSCVSVTRSEHSPFKMFQTVQGKLTPLFTWDELDKPRQQLPVTYRHNGAMYLAACRDFIVKKTFFIKPVVPYVMGMAESIDIDSADDLALCESVLAHQEAAQCT
ncbi:acylneuraminate cytidylyltransferase family protein [Desulfogranum marinum]|uniref:acylneuraminate cytidylyltransferase family protein n=1 Tax=Desulfogranum marinum TaxID=453220 RepID=UPI001962E034|nr:acylneuraminate cytidylyltransferase family protein [Desulfogranum marinum]MBM9513002.1 acylneuraminate cytidylyltransferase family protein [Desulfogranum marinum]